MELLHQTVQDDANSQQHQEGWPEKKQYSYTKVVKSYSMLMKALPIEEEKTWYSLILLLDLLSTSVRR